MIILWNPATAARGAHDGGKTMSTTLIVFFFYLNLHSYMILSSKNSVDTLLILLEWELIFNVLILSEDPA